MWWSRWLSGRIVGGRRLGRTLGFPTANIPVHRKVLPLSGVFAVEVYGVEKTAIPGVASIGTRPTVSGREPLLEVFLFDFSGDVYGLHLDVDFFGKLRDEWKFDSLEDLKEQMVLDARQARAMLCA